VLAIARAESAEGVIEAGILGDDDDECLIGVVVWTRSADLSGSVAPAFAVNAPSAAAVTPTRKPSFLLPGKYLLPRILVLPRVKSGGKLVS
jgi:hypothetical protein